MDPKQEIQLLKQELSKVKKILKDRDKDLSLYKKEIQQLNQEVGVILRAQDQDLSFIRQVFQHLVPTQFPHIEGVHFSTKFITGMRLNGDYIDVFEQQDKFKFNLILSSSRGPSLTAFLIAFLLKYGREVGETGLLSPEDFIARVVKGLESKKEDASGIQLGCVLVDQRSYEMTHGLHGQVQAFYHQSKTGKIIELKAQNAGTKFSLEAHDRIVLASPGLLAAANSKGTPFTINPILESFSKVPLTQSPHDLRNEIFYRLDQHLDGRRPLQDVSLIIMSVGNKVIKLV